MLSIAVIFSYQKLVDFSNQMMSLLDQLKIKYLVKSNITISVHFCDDEVPLWRRRK